MAITAADIRVKFSSEGAGAVRSDITGVGGAVDAVQGKLSSWGKNLRTTGTWLTAGVTTPLVAFFTTAINGASSLEQAQGKVDAVFKNSADVVQQWSKTTADSIGVSETQALQWTGTIGNFFTSAGIAHDQAAQMSQDFITLSADMAAFNDVSAARASDALISGLAGEYDALQRLGINIKAATVEEEALAIAMADGREEITENDRALARYNVIMRESANQHGQFKREASGFAGQLAILKAQFSELVTEIGGHLIPHATAFIGVLRQLVAGIDALSPSMQRWAVVAGLVAAALGPILIAIGLMLPGLGVMIGLFAAMVSPIGLVVAAVAALAVVFRGPLMSGLRRVGSTVKDAIDAFRDMWDSLSGITEIVERSQGFYAEWTRTVEVATNATNTLSRFLYSLAAAFASIGGENTPAWIAAVSRGLIEMARTVEELVGWFQTFRELGINPVSSALLALGATFEPLMPLMSDLADMVANLQDAFQAFMDGNWSLGFAELGNAAQDAWGAIQAGIGLISELAMQVADWVLNVGAPAVVGAAQDIWDAVSDWVVNTAWPTVKATAIALGDVVLDIGGWARGKAPQIWEFVSGWVRALIATAGNVAGEIAEATLDILVWARGKAPQVREFVSTWVDSLVSTAGNVAGVIESATVNITSWVEGEVADITSAIESWLGTPLVPVTANGDVSWGDVGVPANSSTALMIRDKIGDLTVGGIVATLDFIGEFGSLEGVAETITGAKDWLVGQALKVAGVALEVSFLASLGPLGVKGLAGVALVVANNVADYFANNPLSLVELAVAFKAILDSEASDFALDIAAIELAILDALGVVPGAPLLLELPTTIKAMWDGEIDLGFTKEDIVEGIINSIVPGGGALDIELPVDINPFNNGDEKDGEGGGTSGSTLFGSNWGARLDGIIEDMRSAAVAGLESIRGDIQTKAGEWASALQGGIAPLGGIAATAFGAVSTSATTGLGAATAAVIAGTGQILAVTVTNLGSMAASALASFTSIRTTATTNTTAMQAGVTAGMNAMRATSTAAVAGMQAGIAASMLVMRSSAVSSANAMQSSVVAAMTNMALRSAAAVRSGMGQIPGIIASVGGAAAGVAFSVGAAIGNGVAAGMLSALGTIRAAANAMISEALRAAQARAIIASPSKLFEREVGVHISEGVAEGIERASGVVQRAVSDMLDVNGLLDRLVYLVNEEVIGAVRNSIPEAGTFSNPYTIGLPGTAGRRYPTQFDNRVIFEAGSIVQREGESTPELAERIASLIAKMQNRDLETVIGGSMV